jgi:hypothetical protein
MEKDLLASIVWGIIGGRSSSILAGAHRTDADKEYFSEAASIFLDALLADDEVLSDDICLLASEVLSEYRSR